MKREIEKPVSEELTRIAFTATSGQLEKFHRLKSLLAHKNFASRYDLLFEELADIALAKLDAAKLRARKVKKHQTKQGLVKTRTRYIPRRTKLLVRTKAQARCQYIDAQSGRSCESKHGLQIDHIHPYAHGGSNELENLQLLCSAHNRWLGDRSVNSG